MIEGDTIKDLEQITEFTRTETACGKGYFDRNDWKEKKELSRREVICAPEGHDDERS